MFRGNVAVFYGHSHTVWSGNVALGMSICLFVCRLGVYVSVHTLTLPVIFDLYKVLCSYLTYVYSLRQALSDDINFDHVTLTLWSMSPTGGSVWLNKHICFDVCKIIIRTLYKYKSEDACLLFLQNILSLVSGGVGSSISRASAGRRSEVLFK